MSKSGQGMRRDLADAQRMRTLAEAHRDGRVLALLREGLSPEQIRERTGATLKVIERVRRAR